ncbi:MAG: class I SAM-dependent rRNA methyltransferase [Spirochaetota bacterium]|jgi:23S rRNA (cytosine1962-C5)-methyltransferase|nr:class I SAM-dependent rRNA methyltransferase [Spirochaetota bacterium]
MIQLRGERHRVLAGHPWVYANEIAEPCSAEDAGDTAALYDARGRFVASGIYNPRSQIVWRRYSFSSEDLDAVFIRRALLRALNRRAQNPVCRLVWSESDSLPGLTVDRYDDVLVLQAQTRALDARIPIIADILCDLLHPRALIVRNEAKVRALEGLSCHTYIHSGELRPEESVRIDGILFHIDFQNGQKTGLYLDQREHYGRAARYAAGRRVLDAFCNQGGFALFAARAGAGMVRAIDSSESALSLLRRNAEANGCARIETVVANVFDYFHQNRDERWDLVILDPPPFAPVKKRLDSAYRGYKELNLRAAQSLNRGGILMSFSCSHHIGLADFTEIVREAFSDAGKSAHILEYLHQPPDHPILLDMPESEYLCGLIVEVP